MARKFIPLTCQTANGMGERVTRQAPCRTRFIPIYREVGTLKLTVIGAGITIPKRKRIPFLDMAFHF